MQATSPAETAARTGAGSPRIEVVRSLAAFAAIIAIRSAVYIEGQDCPYAEEFDGNDLCAMHLLGFLGGEPAGCLRMRFFADFAKVERLAVRETFRGGPLAFALVREALRLAARKGYRRAYGHAQEGTETFWGRFGAKPLDDAAPFSFSGRRYREMLIELPPAADAITLRSGPMVINRPEGSWDQPGALERGGGDGGWNPALREQWDRWARGAA